MQAILSSLLLSAFFSTLQATVKIMPLGDSITWDWHYNDSRTDAQRHGYRNYLWYKLQSAEEDVNFVGSRHNGGSVNPSFDGDNEGYTGYTTHQIADLVYAKLKKSAPDIILLHIGTNDSVKYSPYDMSGLKDILNKIDTYEKNYHRHITVILARIIPLPKAGDWVKKFNNSLDKMAADRIKNGDDIKVVNMNGISSLVDGIHPTNSGYQQMSAIWFKEVEKAILEREDYTYLIPVYGLLLQ